MFQHKIKKGNTELIISIIISLGIILSFMAYITLINLSRNTSNYSAKNGYLNLSTLDFKSKKTINLDGEWEFYPGVLIEPSENGTGINAFDEHRNIKKYINVPGPWKYIMDKESKTGGSGTYRLIINVPSDEFYGIKTRTIRTSSRIYLNGKEIISMGNPSQDLDKFIPDSKYKLGVGNSLNKEIELVIHVSSDKYRTGGILKSIQFGHVDTIIMMDQKENAIDALIISACLVLGVYFFLTFLQRGKDVYLAYFSATSTFMGLYLSTMNEQLLNLVFDYDFVTRTRIQIVCMVMVIVCFVKSIHHFFRDYGNKRAIHTIVGMTLCNLLFIFNNLENQSSISYGLMQASLIIGIVLNFGYIFYVLLNAIYHKAEFLGYILIITTSIFMYLLSVSLKILFEIDLGYGSLFLIFVLVIVVALLMAHRLQLDCHKVNALSERLMMQDRLKDEFLARASHELRTPLHIILNLIKFLLEGKRGTINSQQQEDLVLIQKEGKRLIRLVEDLLNASQIKQGKTKLRVVAFQPYEIVEGILKEMRFFISNNKNIKIINKIPKNFPSLNADPDKFIQIIYNLVHNAIKYTRSGEIIVSASLLDGQAEITVRDTGIGIEEKYLEEVFDTFFQKSENEVYEDQGLGLGLPIVKHLVESHGGNIHIESAYRKGTSVRLTLPLYDDKSIDTNKITSKATYVQNRLVDINLSNDQIIKIQKNNIKNPESKTILIVDDETLNQRVLSDIIDDMGFDTIHANSGKEAISILEIRNIDLVVLDFMLPDMSGDQVCNEIRKKYSMVELPILILTASGRIDDLIDAFEYGANDFQKKPADSEELRSRIQSLILMKTTVEEGLKREFQYFYSQISPHFLYNTLNTIIGLSYNDSEKTRKALNNLSIYFRGKLDLYKDKSLIPMDVELELVKAYLEIEQMRYGDKLNIIYDIDEEIKVMIPPLTLQPLIENSIRHGLAQKNHGGSIKISIKRTSMDTVSIAIEDDGVGMSKEKQQEILEGKSQRLGFKNIVEKIIIIKGASIEIESHENQGTKVTIIVPEVKSYESYPS